AADLQPAGPCSTLHHGEPVARATFSSDSRRILTSCFDGAVRIWDLAGATMPPPSAAEQRFYCRDARRYVVTTGKVVQAVETSPDKPISPPFEPAATLEKAQLSDDGALVLTLSRQEMPGETKNVIQVWDPQTTRAVGPQVVVKEPFAGAALSPSGERIAV